MQQLEWLKSHNCLQAVNARNFATEAKLKMFTPPAQGGIQRLAVTCLSVRGQARLQAS
jgi:hypothetical protein